MSGELERLREQAARCLRLARATLDGAIAEKLKALAADYLAQAQLLEPVTLPPRQPPAAAPMQQQQQIQPNSETKDEVE